MTANERRKELVKYKNRRKKFYRAVAAFAKAVTPMRVAFTAIGVAALRAMRQINRVNERVLQLEYDVQAIERLTSYSGFETDDGQPYSTSPEPPL